MFVYMNKTGLKIMAFMLLSLFSFGANAAADPYQLIMDRINADLHHGLNEVTLQAQVSAQTALLRVDGSWADIDYSNPNYDPLGRIKLMATAYSGINNKLYNDSRTYAAIVQSLQQWLDRNPKNKNWWYNEIFYPKAIGETLILMRYAKTPLPASLEKALIIRMTRKLKTGDYANTSDEALHYLYRACLTERQSTLDSAAKYLFEPVSVIDGKEGVQVDNSYFQHGKQQAIATYGAVFAGNSVNAAFYLRGTSYAMPDDQLKILVNYIKDTFLHTLRASFFDFNVRGRGISRKDSLKGSAGGILDKIKILSPENAVYWQAAEKRINQTEPPAYGITPSNRMYWKSGYTLHIRPGYTFSVQAASSRTLRTERGNNENVLGKFLADGATNIQLRGNEYANLMPVWEWDKIPGVTCRDYPDDEGATIKQDWGIPGTTAFVGGVSDGLYGLSVYAQSYDQVEARKAWFFFDREIVCLGAGIRSTADQEVRTTLNQSWLNGKVIVAVPGDGIKTIENTEQQYTDPLWIWHDAIGYFFPSGGHLTISNQTQTGSWYRINQSQPKDELKDPVFKLSLNHGDHPVGGQYAYIVVPGLKEEEMRKGYDLSKIQILKNTEDLQAVTRRDLDILQLVFYKPGTLKTSDLTIQADKACTILIRGLYTKTPVIYIADPAQENNQIQLELLLPGLKMVKKMNCVMPAGPLSGSTLKMTINQ